MQKKAVPSLSMVALILLAAFSLSSPGWLLLMENNVMTPAKLGNSYCVWKETEQLYRLLSLCYRLTSYKEIATDNEYHADRSQNKPSTISVVFVADKADSTDRVSVDLCGGLAEIMTSQHLVKTTQKNKKQ